jgi:hypothetical protein
LAHATVILFWDIPSGVEAQQIEGQQAARLKSCPVTKRPQILVRREYFRSL